MSLFTKLGSIFRKPEHQLITEELLLNTYNAGYMAALKNLDSGLGDFVERIEKDPSDEVEVKVLGDVLRTIRKSIQRSIADKEAESQ